MKVVMECNEFPYKFEEIRYINYCMCRLKPDIYLQVPFCKVNLPFLLSRTVELFIWIPNAQLCAINLSQQQMNFVDGV